MVLFEAIIQVPARSVLDLATKYPAYGAGVRVVLVCSHLRRSMANNLSCLCEEALSCLHIPVLRKHGVHQIAVPVYRPVQVAPLAREWLKAKREISFETWVVSDGTLATVVVPDKESNCSAQGIDATREAPAPTFQSP